MATTHPPLFCRVFQRTGTRSMGNVYMERSKPQINRPRSLITMLSSRAEAQHQVFSIVSTRMEISPSHQHQHQVANTSRTRCDPRVHILPSWTNHLSSRPEPTQASAPSPSAGRRTSAAIRTFSTPPRAEAVAPAVLSASSRSPKSGSPSRLSGTPSASSCRGPHMSPPWPRMGLCPRTSLCLRRTAVVFPFSDLVTSRGEVDITDSTASGVALLKLAVPFNRTWVLVRVLDGGGEHRRPSIGHDYCVLVNRGLWEVDNAAFQKGFGIWTRRGSPQDSLVPLFNQLTKSLALRAWQRRDTPIPPSHYRAVVVSFFFFKEATKLPLRFLQCSHPSI